MNSGLTAEILYIMENLEMAKTKIHLLFEYLLAMLISLLLEKLRYRNISQKCMILQHSKPIPEMKFFSQGKTCFHYREPCSHCRDGFAVRVPSERNPCNYCGENIYSVAGEKSFCR